MGNKNSMESFQKTSEYLKVMAHPIRLKIINILRANPISVGELAGECAISSQETSGHLRKLYDRGVLKKQRQGRKVFYQVIETVFRKNTAELPAQFRG
jgi:ArsR family transcriptional regulator